MTAKRDKWPSYRRWQEKMRFQRLSNRALIEAVRKVLRLKPLYKR